MSEEQKKGRGRPKVENAVVLAEIMKNEATRRKFKQQIDVLVESKKVMINESECFSEDVAAVAEDTGLGKGFITKIVTAIAKNNEESVKAESEGIAEVLETIFNITDNE